jgi:hypothetical protein
MEEENKEPGFILTSTKNTKVSFKKVPLKLRLKIMLGAQIAVKQEIEPIAVNDGIEISISEHLKQK